MFLLFHEQINESDQAEKETKFQIRKSGIWDVFHAWISAWIKKPIAPMLLTN